MAKKLIDKSIPRFLLVGVGNTLLSMALMFLLERLGYWPSTAIAYVAGAVMSFFLNRHFTFHSEETLGRSAVKFAVNVAVCYVVGYGLARLIVGGPPPLTAVPAVWWGGSLPQPGAPECPAGGADDGEGAVRHGHLHGRRPPGRH